MDSHSNPHKCTLGKEQEMLDALHTFEGRNSFQIDLAVDGVTLAAPRDGDTGDPACSG